MSAIYSAMGDEELWSRARTHDGDAFGELFRRHSDAVYNHCFRRTGSWATAEDLTSIVFLQAWRRRAEVVLVGESVLPWLLAVANNTSRNADRAVRREQRLLNRLPRLQQLDRSSVELDSKIDDEKVMKAILAKVKVMKVEERDVIALCDWSNLTYAEAAKALEIPIGTVRSRLSRARVHLRSLLDIDISRDSRSEFAVVKSTKEDHDNT